MPFMLWLKTEIRYFSTCDIKQLLIIHDDAGKIKAETLKYQGSLHGTTENIWFSLES